MKNKTICFDLRPLQIGHENRGIGMVVKSVLEKLPNDGTQYLFYMFDRNNPIESLSIDVSVLSYTTVQTPTLKHAVKIPRDFIDGLKITFHNFKRLKKYRPDVFVQFDIALGVPKWRGVKTFAIGYDLIPLIMKEEYLPSPLKSLRFDRESIDTISTKQFATILLRPGLLRHIVGLSLKSVKRSLRSSYHLLRYKHALHLYKKVDGVLCISKATRASFQSLLNIPESKLHDLPLAPVLSKDLSDTALAKTVKKPYIFYIGGTDERKRVQDIIYAYNIARGRGSDIRLVLAGNEFVAPKKIPNKVVRDAILHSPYKDEIVLTGFVNDSQKLGLYKEALAFIFSSSYEGFGLPIVEAGVMGCPVIAYDNSSIAELSNPSSAFLVKTGDISGLARSISELQNNPSSTTKIVQKALSASKLYSWDKTTKKLLKIVTSN